MMIKVLAFGIAKDIFQNAFAEIDVETDLTVSDLKVVVEEKYPKLALLKSYMVAVNNEYAKDDQVLNSTDEIAIIPPVSGG
jgi:molybdopterin synthase sulfur carrier subunit